MSNLAIDRYGLPGETSNTELLGNARAVPRPRVIRSSRHRVFASSITMIAHANSVTVGQLAEVLCVDRRCAWNILNGGRATAAELNLAMQKWSAK